MTTHAKPSKVLVIGSGPIIIGPPSRHSESASGGRRISRMRDCYVYIMTNGAKTLYVGVTNDLERRVLEHKAKLVPGFTARYNLTRLVYYETTPDIASAIAREKQIKGWLRSKKMALVDSMNRKWRDLSLAWGSPEAETLRFTQGDREDAQRDGEGVQSDRKAGGQG